MVSARVVVVGNARPGQPPHILSTSFQHEPTLNARNKYPDHSTAVKEGESLILSVLMSPLKHEDIPFEDVDSSVSVVS